MKVIVKAGVQAWFAVKFLGADVSTFSFDTPVEVSPVKDTDKWVGAENVPGFPTGHPTILIHKDDIS